MKLKNLTFENSLQCMQHPFTILAIGMIVLNDHVFKQIAPSWLTGKLSDFAGLFFFPFLLAAGLSSIFASFKISAPKIGAIAIAITGLWFFLLKTSIVVNSISAQSASAILGFPVVYALDASDTLALMMLVPAWLLWSSTKSRIPQKRSWVFLLLGLLASIASSPAVPPVEADILLYRDHVLYAIDLTSHRSESSQDLGIDWNEFYGYEVPPNVDFEKARPDQVCDPKNVRVCYRTPGNGTVEMTFDDGFSWTPVWSLGLPAGRVGAIERIMDKKIDLGPYDLLIVQEDDQRVLFAAMGNQGVLKHRLPDGDWVRKQIVYDTPTSGREPDFVEANAAVGQDWIRWELVSIFTLLAASGWLRYKDGSASLLNDKKLSSSVLLLVALFAYLVVAIIVMALATIIFSFLGFQRYLSAFLFLIGYLIPFFWLLAYMKKLSTDVMAKSEDVIKTILVSAVSALAVLFFGVSPVILWVQGTIEKNSDVVLWTVLPLTCIILSWFFFLYRRGYLVSKQNVIE